MSDDDLRPILLGLRVSDIPRHLYDEVARLLAERDEMAVAILAWGRGLEWVNGKPIPKGDALKRAIEGANKSDGMLLRIVAKLREVDKS